MNGKALAQAAMGGDLDIVELLIQKGNDIHVIEEVHILYV